MVKKNQQLAGWCGYDTPIDDAKEFDVSPAPESYVYMFYSAGKIKIGMSRDPIQRLDALNNSSSVPVQLVWVSFGTRRDEGILHKRFKTDRLNGEWFRLSDEIRTFINSGGFEAYLRAAERNGKSRSD